MRGADSDIKIVFKNDSEATNNLIRYIINSILENFDKLGEILGGDKDIKSRRGDTSDG